MGEYVTFLRDTIDRLPERESILILSVVVIALALYTVRELAALSIRVDLTERASVVLLCRAGELDHDRDPRACWFFMQGEEERFRPPDNWQRPLDESGATVP